MKYNLNGGLLPTLIIEVALKALDFFGCLLKIWLSVDFGSIFEKTKFFLFS